MMMENKKILLQVEDNGGELRFITNNLSTLETLGIIKYLDLIKDDLMYSIKNDEED